MLMNMNGDSHQLFALYSNQGCFANKQFYKIYHIFRFIAKASTGIAVLGCQKSLCKLTSSTVIAIGATQLDPFRRCVIEISCAKRMMLGVLF